VSDAGRSTCSPRRFLPAVVVAAAPAALFARAQAFLGRDSRMLGLEPTPAAGDQLELIPEETSVPFFRPNSPLLNVVL